MRYPSDEDLLVLVRAVFVQHDAQFRAWYCCALPLYYRHTEQFEDALNHESRVSQDASGMRTTDEIGAVSCAGALEHLGDVLGDCVLADMQTCRDLNVSQAFRR